MDKIITLTLFAPEVQLVLEVMSNAPYKVVAGLIQKIQVQGNSQLEEVPMQQDEKLT